MFGFESCCVTVTKVFTVFHEMKSPVRCIACFLYYIKEGKLGEDGESFKNSTHDISTTLPLNMLNF